MKCCVSRETLATLSRHEILFGFTKDARYWHAGLLQIVQLTLVVCVAWTIMALGSEVAAIVALLGDTAASTQIPVKLILPIVQLNILVVTFKVFSDWVPATLKTYAMATSTEMMKDRAVIDNVIQNQKREKNERNYRVFQAMRLMRREYMKMLFVDNLSEDGGSNSEYGEEVARTVLSDSGLGDPQMPAANSKRLKDVTVKHIVENFQKLGKPGQRFSARGRHTMADGDDDDSMRTASYRYADPDDANWTVGVDKIPHLISMCGGDLRKSESFYLLRRSNYVSVSIFYHVSYNIFACDVTFVMYREHVIALETSHAATSLTPSSPT